LFLLFSPSLYTAASTTMQQLPTILPLQPLPDGTIPERSPEHHINLMRFQSELEVSVYGRLLPRSVFAVFLCVG
jgi:hypothetical protein